MSFESETVADLCVSVAIGLCLLLLSIQSGRLLYQRIETAFSRLAARRRVAALVVFFSVIGIRLLVIPVLPVPTPGVHDEFSYLLMGDTFAHGRLTNPTHPLWMSFETFHVNWQPTYASMYPPAQGVILAIGQLLGHPWIGVLLSNAAMCVAIFWALQGWMPVRWAFLGAMLTVLKFEIGSYWINSYWGGAAASIGGALVIGALGRLRKRVKRSDAVCLALGFAVLANSRPYEGLFFCLPAALWFVCWLAGRVGAEGTGADNLRMRLRKGLVPLGCILILTAAFMGHYNWRLTGRATLMPRALNAQRYYRTPLFLWQQARPELHYNNVVFQSFYNEWLRSSYHADWFNAEKVSGEKLDRFRVSYFWAGAVLILPAAPFLFLDSRMKILWVTLATSLAGIFAVIWSNPHYAAALLCVFYALLIQAMRHLRSMRVSKSQLGVALSRAVVLLLLLDAGRALCYRVCDPLLFPCQGNQARAVLEEKLAHLPGKHLVVVRYSGVHNFHKEWVYNGAEIDSAKVLWARELDPQQNQKLFTYYQDRKLWLLAPDDDKAALTPYLPVDSREGPLNASQAKPLPR